MKAFCYIAKSLRYCVNGTVVKAGIIFPPFVILLFSNLQAQYFNVRVDFMNFGLAEVGFSIEKMDSSNYIVFHGARTESGDNLGLGRTILSPQGQVLNEMVYFNELGPTYTGHKNTSTKIPSGYVASGSRSWFTPTLESLITLSKYDDEGELVWIKEYGDQIHQSIGRAATMQMDYTIAATGGISALVWGDVDGFLWLTDSNGEEIDFITYGGEGVEEFYSIYATQDGGYLLGGRQKATSAQSVYNHYIVKTDSFGNQEWMRVIGSPRNDCSAAVIQTMDGNYVFCGCWNNYNASPNAPFNTLFMAKLGSTGQPIWQKEFTESTLGAILFTVKELPDGGLVSAGIRHNGNEAVLLRTDADGNELWIRTMTHPSVEGGLKLFHDVIVEDDGGFVGTGYLFGTSSDPQPGQDLWVFRTDSMGCLVPGCHLIDNIEVQKEQVLVSLYPNPVIDLLNVHIKSGSMPRGAQLELYDVNGRKHSTTTINPGATTYILQLGHLPAGMYLLRCVTDSEVVWSGKVVKN